jgi:transglutaminase-like putative cysteine protease
MPFVEVAGRWPREGLRYEPGATPVGWDLEEVFTRGTGVCQDNAHALVQDR